MNDEIKMQIQNAMLRMLNLDKIADFMLENDTRSFGFMDLNERASYSAFLTEEEDGRQMLTIKKTFVKEKK